MNNFNKIKTDEEYSFSLHLVTQQAATRYINQGRTVPNYHLLIKDVITGDREVHGVYIRPESNHMIGKFNDLLCNFETDLTPEQKQRKLRAMHNLKLIGA